MKIEEIDTEQQKKIAGQNLFWIIQKVQKCVILDGFLNFSRKIE